MNKFHAFLFMLAIFCFVSNAACPADPEPWITMPPGARPSYMGIHGGTMPVSLLVAKDGSSLFTFVGLTGNDFIDALKKAQLPLPSFGNSTFQSQAKSGASRLFAGNATASLPVFALSGDSDLSASLQPFGLSDAPLSIEGAATPPEPFPHARRLRAFSLPEYFLRAVKERAGRP